MVLLFKSNKYFWLEVECIKKLNARIFMRFILMGVNRLFCTDGNYQPKNPHKEQNLN